MKQKDILKGSLDLKVQIIDWSIINKKISEAVGEKVECRIGKGLIQDVMAVFDKDIGNTEIKSLILDKECCGIGSETYSLYISELNNGKPFQVNVIPDVEFYKVIKENENGGFSVAMFPSYIFHIDLDDVVACITGEEISLYKFMDSRYNYNPRIRTNEINILNLVYHTEKMNGNKCYLEIETLEIT